MTEKAFSDNFSGPADGENAAEPDEAAEEMDESDIEALNRDIEKLCISKAEEFRLLGYENVTGEDIWNCVSANYEEGAYPSLHRLVNDILSLKPNQFMNWMTLKLYKKGT